MQACDFATYGRDCRAFQIALPLEAAPKITPITPVAFEEGERVRVINSHIKEEIGKLGTIGKPTKEVKDRVRVLLDGDYLYRLFGPECLVKVFTPITPVLDGCELDNPLQLPTDTVKSVMGVEVRLAQLEAERSRIMAEGAIAQKGVWIEGFTTVRQRKSGKQVRYSNSKFRISQEWQ
ncbi:MAG: hypothetical protein HC935_02200 [Pseudanabaena sp. SU_2_4]|nr:hypothetical protein [Pseudanabaena sp. SU_2_4]